VDETAVNIAGRQVWLWIATESGHRIVLASMLTEARNVLVAYNLFACLRCHRIRHIITDSAPWYRLAAGWTRFRHSIMHEGMHSYVERFIEAVKDRLRGFDCYFPSPKKLLDSAPHLLYAWVGFYNLCQSPSKL